MKKHHNKLIRDKIPEIIKRAGDGCKISVLSEENYKQELLKKLVEEAQEVLEAGGDQRGLEKELADVFEVIDCTIKTFGLDREAIKKKQAEKRGKRGGFDEQIFLEYTH